MPDLTAPSLLEAFEQSAAAAPEAPLVEAPGRTARRRDVAALGAAVGRRVAAETTAPGTLVVLAVPNGPAFLAALLACWRGGAVPVLADAASPPRERERVAAALGARLSLGAEDGWCRDASAFRLDPAAGTGTRSVHPDLAVVKLTSGSTGTPRGIGVPEGALVADDEQLRRTMGIRSDDRLLTAIPLSHSYGLASLALPALRSGLPLVLPDTGSPLAALAAARALAATFFPAVPALLQALASLPERPAWSPSLRRVTSAGARLEPATAAAFRARFGLPVHVFYGASECGGIAYDRAGGAAERGTVGTPVEGVQVDLETADDASSGRIVVRSAAVAARYLPHPEPERLGAGRFATTDLGGWRSGELALVGRSDELVAIRGKKVNPQEVEAVLAAHPDVREVRVIGFVEARTGEGRLRAVVACAPRRRLAYPEMLAWCRPRLAPHKVPRSLVVVEALPRTSRGKVDRSDPVFSPAPRGAGER
jgi:long-chain acyl-CoA synthetase